MSASDCGSCGGKKSAGAETMSAIGAVGFLTFKIWEMIDIWLVSDYNSRIRAAKQKTDAHTSQIELKPFLIPTHAGGGLAGLAVHF